MFQHVCRRLPVGVFIRYHLRQRIALQRQEGAWFRAETAQQVGAVREFASESKTARDDGRRLKLRRAHTKLKSLPPTTPRAVFVEHRINVLKAFETAWSDLFQHGQLFHAAARLPLSDVYAESLVKALSLFLSRRLREQKGQSLPSAELPHVPRFLQRLGVADHDLYEDFCKACRRSWPTLAHQLGDFDRVSRLLRGAEDYALLHQTRGTALERLVGALVCGLREERSRPDADVLRPAAIHALARAVLEVRARSICTSLIAELRTSVLDVLERQKSDTVDVSHSALLLAAAADLHAAGSMEPCLQSSLQTLLGNVKEDISNSDDHPFLSRKGVPVFLRALGFSYWSLPDMTRELLSTWAARVQASAKKKTAASPAAEIAELSIRYGRHLPADLRRLLVESLAANVTASTPQNDRVVSARLALLHDLPFSAYAKGDHKGSLALASQMEAVLSQALTAKETAPTYQPGTYVWAFLASNDGAQCLKGIGGEEVKRITSSLSRHSETALKELNASWADITLQDVEILFRTMGDATEVASLALRNIEKVRCLGVQIAVLNSVARITSTEELEKTKPILVRSLKKPTRRRTELSAAEASLLRGPLAQVGAAKLQGDLLVELRQHLFRDTVTAEPVWCRTPSQGFVEYVQRCSDRGREASQNVSKPSATHAAISA
eukprot:TRINITY_DN16329_c0_g1_i1.p1 TRINITY_DN16329_c0_g1~~TRINITY_DN16329_c0_g1_i1.p1  ORF type:complete len:668 (+),score=91.26 TRINITY_DN16329_c0_g1_i1:237-2240(+)